MYYTPPKFPSYSRSQGEENPLSPVQKDKKKRKKPGLIRVEDIILPRLLRVKNRKKKYWNGLVLPEIGVLMLIY